MNFVLEEAKSVIIVKETKPLLRLKVYRKLNAKIRLEFSPHILYRPFDIIAQKLSRMECEIRVA